ncbi:class I SAM-dependent methyltransferase, partial [Piscirickettsia litoralis]
MKKAYSSYHNADIERAIFYSKKRNKKTKGMDEKPWLLLGQIYFDNKQYEESISFFESGYKINKNPDICFDLAVCYYFCGKYIASAKFMIDNICNQRNKNKLSKSKQVLFKIIEDAASNDKALYSEFYFLFRDAWHKSKNINIYAIYIYMISIIPYNLIVSIDDIHADLDLLLKEDFGGLDQVQAAVHGLVVRNDDFIKYTSQDKNIDINLVKAIFKENLLNHYLDKFLITSRVIEVFLIKCRKSIVRAISSKESNIFELMNIICLISKQAWQSEYIYYYSEGEIELLNSILELNREKPYYLLSLMYFQPDVKTVDLIRSLFVEDNVVDRLLETINIDNLIKKEKIREIVKINNDSEKVKEMYEENPYPRWTYFNFIDQNIQVETILHKYCRPSNYSFLKNKEQPRVLIAGGGTGFQPITLANSLDYSEFIVIDICQKSLQYAQYMAGKSGIENIDFYLADILNIEKEKIGLFDYIECSGVLHHLKEPLAGWKKLTNVLNKNGVMKIGLYSCLGRRKLNEFKTQHEYETSQYRVKDLYSIRNEILSNPQSDCSFFFNWKDFFSASCFRDLVSHVQESQYTIIRIKEELDYLGMEFLGFQILKPTYNLFMSEFKYEKYLFDLECWDKF